MEKPYAVADFGTHTIDVNGVPVKAKVKAKFYYDHSLPSSALDKDEVFSHIVLEATAEGVTGESSLNEYIVDTKKMKETLREILEDHGLLEDALKDLKDKIEAQVRRLAKFVRQNPSTSLRAIAVQDKKTRAALHELDLRIRRAQKKFFGGTYPASLQKLYKEKEQLIKRASKKEHSL